MIPVVGGGPPISFQKMTIQLREKTQLTKIVSPLKRFGHHSNTHKENRDFSFKISPSDPLPMGRNLDPFPPPPPRGGPSPPFPQLSKKNVSTNEKSKNYEKIKYPSWSSGYIPDIILDISDTF